MPPTRRSPRLTSPEGASYGKRDPGKPQESPCPVCIGKTLVPAKVTECGRTASSARGKSSPRRRIRSSTLHPRGAARAEPVRRSGRLGLAQLCAAHALLTDGMLRRDELPGGAGVEEGSGLRRYAPARESRRGHRLETRASRSRPDLVRETPASNLSTRPKQVRSFALDVIPCSGGGRGGGGGGGVARR